MNEEKQEGNVPRLGGMPEGRIQRYFCVDDDNCHALERVSKDAKIISKETKEITVMGQVVKGWVVELEVPVSDGAVRMDAVPSP
ncbi:MAG: hypothetical protein QGG64_17750 [Candidatus Latescibacteria bacterium]|jgi:hypothetical protein|nr:hypothetical protein [Candidatus Latescibacterota bacterium]